MHYTGNKGDSPENNSNWFRTVFRGAGAHYFVGDKSIVQVVEDHKAAWHVGDGKGRFGITNANSLGIEMCGDINGNITNTAEKNALELVEYLQKKYGIPDDRVIRHYDASRKNCPSAWRANGWARWHAFKKSLEGQSIP